MLMTRVVHCFLTMLLPCLLWILVEREMLFGLPLVPVLLSTSPPIVTLPSVGHHYLSRRRRDTDVKLLTLCFLPAMLGCFHHTIMLLPTFIVYIFSGIWPFLDSGLVGFASYMLIFQWLVNCFTRWRSTTTPLLLEACWWSYLGTIDVSLISNMRLWSLLIQCHPILPLSVASLQHVLDFEHSFQPFLWTHGPMVFLSVTMLQCCYCHCVHWNILIRYSQTLELYIRHQLHLMQRDIDFQKLFGVTHKTRPSMSLPIHSSCPGHNVSHFRNPLLFMAQPKFNDMSISDSQAMQGLNVSLPFGQMLPAILDSGASRTSLGNRHEFKTLVETTANTVMKGIAAGLDIKGSGTVEYHVTDDRGRIIKLEMEAYYVPSLPADLRLISPQGLRTVEGHRASVTCHSSDDSSPGYAELFIRRNAAGWQKTPPLHVKTIQYDGRNNLPILHLTLPNGSHTHLNMLTAALCVTDSHNRNLTNAQKELLQWHFRLGHVGFKHLQWMIRAGRLHVANAKAVGNCPVPKCAACEFGKASRRPTETSTTRPDSEKTMELKQGDLIPGQCVSMDHYQCANPGRLYTSRGSTAVSDMYVGGSIFVDHATGFVMVNHQVSINGADSIHSKVRFEQSAKQVGVAIQQYHTDNGIFSTKTLLDELSQRQQRVRFAGTGTGHQNGVAERGIKTIVQMARTMLLHAAMRSPDGFVRTDLWPMAMDHATWIYNHLPKMDSGVSPMELWSRSITSTADLLMDCHVWGCPVYVLEPKLQKSGIKIPKWDPRSRRGLNMGFSPVHSTLIASVLNLLTHSITPQFHVIFDDWFTSVHSESDIEPSVWIDLITTPSCRLQVPLDSADDPELHDEWLASDDRLLRDTDRRRRAVQLRSPAPPSPSAFERENVDNDSIIDLVTTPDDLSSALNTPQTVRFGSNTRVIDDTPRLVAPVPFALDSPLAPTQAPTASSPILRRSSRTRARPVPYQSDFASARQWKNNEVLYLAQTMANLTISISSQTKLNSLLTDIDAETTATNYSPASYAAKPKHDPDTPSYVEAMSGEQSEDYWRAMQEEISALVKRNTWEILPRSQCPIGTNVVPGTWAFRCKRRPDGSFRKFKARWCVRGDLEKKINGKRGESVDTYSPVVQWSTVRLMLVLTIILGMVTRAVDFSNAFAQADMPPDMQVYLEMPENFAPNDGSDSVLRLKKSLYGQLVAPRLWYEKLSTGLIDRGFVMSDVDPCMFISKKVVVLCYVDDLTIYAMSQKPIDDLLTSFKDDGDEFNWEMTVEGSVHEFLGIDIDRIGDKWKLTQKGLIQNVLMATGMTDCNAKESPTDADGKPLGSDPDGPAAKEEWNYASVVGMLLYLASNSRPDISFAVHQCARFTHGPKASHEKAIIRICRYLKGTANEGIIYSPTQNMSVDCYVDADFAGLYGTEASDDPVSVKSRTGYVILLANCPLLWVSKLQTEIALSTLESEFIALSSSFRSLIPTKRLIEATLSGLDIQTEVKYSAKSTIFEDNSGALRLATTKRLTPRTRHIATKYFWFLDHVDKGLADIVKVDSASNKSDIFTKSLKPVDFLRIRNLLCGW